MSRRTLTTLGLLVLIGLTQLAFAPPAQEAEAQTTGLTLTFWVVLFVIAVIVVLLLIWSLSGSPRSMVTVEDAPLHHEPVAEEESIDEEATSKAKTEPAETVEETASEAAAKPAKAVEETTGEAAAKSAEAVEETTSEAAAEPAETSEAKVVEEVSEPDNLRKIEGIGPKLSQALNGIGITTFAQLATQNPEALEAKLKEAGARFIKGQAQTWPVQAELAAAGKWDELEKLQDEFKGGRRTK